jgi:tetratricopeptide (TPR) repeat protein
MMMIHASIPRDRMSVGSKPVMDALRPHLEALVTAGERAGVQHPTTKLMTDLAWLLIDRCEFGQAETLLRRVIALDEQRFGADYWLMANNLNELASMLCRCKRLAEAESTSRQALAILEYAGGPDHWTIAPILHGLASILYMTDPEEAALHLRRALNINELAFGPTDPRVATEIHALAGAMGPAQRLTDLEPFLRRAREITAEYYGSDHPAHAESLYWEAVRLKEEQEFDKAEELIRNAISIHEICGHENRHMWVNALNRQLGLVYMSTMQFERAEALFLRLRSAFEQRPGFASLRLASFLNNLAQLHTAMKHYAEAELSLCRGRDIYLQFEVDTGRRHCLLPVVINSYRQLLIKKGHCEDDIEVRLHSTLQKMFAPTTRDAQRVKQCRTG